jgi:rhamnulokinase
MEFPKSRGARVAIDLGAQSCRVSLLRWREQQPEFEVMHRFPNAPIASSDGLRWDLPKIVKGVMAGLKQCSEMAPEGIASIGVDGWAVDYVRLDGDGRPVAQPFCHRDSRTEKAADRVHAILPPARLYALTGIQILRINTLYQLYADKLANLDGSLPWVTLPEFITYLLCGKRVSEYTNATHTGLVALGTQKWCEEIFSELGLDLSAAPEIVPSGSVLGPVIGECAALPAFGETKVVVPACHDTASAIAAIPAVGDDWAFISSGTWSLVGTRLDAPCVTRAAAEENFTNLGGVGEKICFLKNVNGMWLLTQCIEEWAAQGGHWALPELLSASAKMPEPATVINVDDSQLMVPGNTIAKINVQLERRGQPKLGVDRDSIPVLANLIFHSLAARYAEVLESISKITGKNLKRLFIVGGGSRNSYLNQLTARRTGLNVIVGSAESTTIGNFAVQLSAEVDRRDRAAGVCVETVAEWAGRLSRSTMEPVGDAQHAN